MRYRFKQTYDIDVVGNIDKFMKFHTFMLSKFKCKCNALREISRGSMGREVAWERLC